MPMEGVQLLFGIIPVVLIVLYIFFSSFRILREYERAVIFRFGRRTSAIFNPGGDGSGPGLLLLIPFVDKMVKVSLRTITMDVPPQDVITRDNVSVKVNAVIFFRVLDANKAVINAEGEFQAAAKLAEAADVLARFPIAVQLRYLQTMREIASERNTTTFFPLPLDLFASLLRAF